DRPGGADGEEECRRLEGEDPVGEHGLGDGGNGPVGGIEVDDRGGGGHPLEVAEDGDGYDAGNEQDGDRTDADSLGGQGLDATLRLVDADEHDHEEEERQDGTGVDDHLDGGHQVGEMDDVDHRHREEGAEQADRRVDRVPGQYHGDRPGESGHGHQHEEDGLNHRRSA